MPRSLHSLFLGPCLLWLTACAGPSGPATPGPASPVARPAASAFPSPSPLVGGKVPATDPAVHVFLWGNPGTTAPDLQLARDGGFRWVKQRFEWRNIEGKNKGNFEWNEPDRILDAISQSGLWVIARRDNQPKRASS